LPGWFWLWRSAILTGAQRLIQRGIEFVGDNIPATVGTADRIRFP
jgi:hypothetical protein